MYDGYLSPKNLQKMYDDKQPLTNTYDDPADRRCQEMYDIRKPTTTYDNTSDIKCQAMYDICLPPMKPRVKTADRRCQPMYDICQPPRCYDAEPSKMSRPEVHEGHEGHPPKDRYRDTYAQTNYLYSHEETQPPKNYRNN